MSDSVFVPHDFLGMRATFVVINLSASFLLLKKERPDIRVWDEHVGVGRGDDHGGDGRSVRGATNSTLKIWKCFTQ